MILSSAGDDVVGAMVRIKFRKTKATGGPIAKTTFDYLMSQTPGPRSPPASPNRSSIHSFLDLPSHTDGRANPNWGRYIYVCVHRHIYTFVNMYVCIYICLYVCKCVPICMNKYININMCMRVSINMYIYI